MFYTLVITIVLFAFFATSEGTDHDDIWTGLNAVWSSNYTAGFYSLPESPEAAESEGWTEIECAKTWTNVKCFALNGDARYAIIYDEIFGNVRGVQMGFPETVVDEDLDIDYDNHRDIVPKIYNGVKYYTTTVWFEIVDGVRRLWIEGQSGRTEYPTDTTSLASGKVYLKKSCYAAMGTHYYQMNSTTDCSDLEPIALLTNGSDVIGISFQILAHVTAAEPGMRQWVEEQYTWDQILETIPDAPYCFLANGTKVGLLSIHSWMIKNPTDLTCSD